MQLEARPFALNSPPSLPPRAGSLEAGSGGGILLDHFRPLSDLKCHVNYRLPKHGRETD